MLVQMRLYKGSIANKKKADVRVLFERQGCPWDDDGGSLITTHSVERYRARRCHGVSPCVTCLRISPAGCA